ncbi:MAG: type II secretion system protein [Chloroflexi bacterium]|nr:MAG: type II secretion system protein [Chloroflexota bacterium]
MDNLYNRVSRRRQPGQKGFTLIELLVVIAILAILAAVVIFNIVGVTNRGKTAAACTDVKTVQSAVDAYYNDNNQSWPAFPATGDGSSNPWPAATSSLVPTYMHQQPPAADGQFSLDTATGRVTAANATGC